MNSTNTTPISIQRIMPPSLPEVRILANIIDTLQVRNNQQLFYNQTPNFNSRLPLFYFENLFPEEKNVNMNTIVKAADSDVTGNETGQPNSNRVEPTRSTSPLNRDITLASPSTPTKTQTTNDNASADTSKMYTAYLILVLKIGKFKNPRGWGVVRRYSEFYALHKYLSTKRFSVPIPAIPPKIIFGNMKEDNIVKRKRGLQTFLSALVTHREFINNEAVVQFLDLDRDSIAPIYKLPDEIFVRIFNYIPFRILFPTASRVSKWIKSILYSSVQSVHLVYVNKRVYFGNVAVAIDSVQELTDLVSSFRDCKVIKLNQFLEFSDRQCEKVLHSCRKAEEVVFAFCGLEEPAIKIDSLPLLQKLNLSYCESLTSINGLLAKQRETKVSLRVLNLSGTSIADESLRVTIKSLPYLHTLVLRKCKQLQDTTIASESLEMLDMRFCKRLINVNIRCPKLKKIDLAFTRINDEVLRKGLFMQRGSVQLKELQLGCCKQLRRPVFICMEQKYPQEQMSLTGEQMNNYTNIRKLIEKHDTLEGNQEKEFKSLEFLEVLVLESCSELESVEIEGLQHLKLIDLRLTFKEFTTENWGDWIGQIRRKNNPNINVLIT